MKEFIKHPKLHIYSAQTWSLTNNLKSITKLCQRVMEHSVLVVKRTRKVGKSLPTLNEIRLDASALCAHRDGLTQPLVE